MNERELERRFRSVREGPEPYAPESLRRFLHELPETSPARPQARAHGLWLTMRRALEPRVALGGGILAFAVVVGIALGGLLMSIRSTDRAAAGPTFLAGGFRWAGNVEPDAIVPRVAVVGGPDGYLGVGPSRAGRGRLLTSKDGLHWTEADVAAIDPRTVDLQWLARGSDGFVAVGATTGAASARDARPEPRFFFSVDGRDWRESVVVEPLKGAPALRVVAGSTGFVALGWNGVAGAPTRAMGVYVWASRDGRSWEGGRTVETVDGPAFLMWARGTYLLSGEPVAAGGAGQGLLPIFQSADGIAGWAQTTGKDNAAGIGPAIAGVASATETKPLLLAWATSAEANAADGRTVLLNGESGVFYAAAVAPGSPVDLRSIASPDRTQVVATTASGVVYVSPDWGVTWQRVGFGTGPVVPNGTDLVDLGNGKLLLVGGSGVWVVEPAQR